MEVSLVQSAKAPSEMLVTLSGMLMDFRPEQPQKAKKSIEVTPSGMVTLVSLVQ